MSERSLGEPGLPGDAVDPRRARRNRVTLWLVIAACAAPVLASYYAYYFVRPEARSNYGELVEPQRPMPSLDLRTLDGLPFDRGALRGKWTMLMVAGGECGSTCVDRLYHLRQVRLTTGRERERVQRVWFIPDAATPTKTLLRDYDGTEMLRVDAAQVASWLTLDATDRYADHIYIVDPLGNLMMRFPVDADPNKTKRDLSKLLRASRIG